MESLWAPATRRAYASLWRRFTLWRQRERLPLTSEAAALFVAATDVKPQAKLTYTKMLRALFNRLSIEVHHLQLLASSLAGAGANRPSRQAPPMEPQQLAAALARWPTAEQPALLLAWKTAARWDDVAKLRLSSVVLSTPKEVVLHFGVMKNTRASPFRPQDLVVITGRFTAAIHRHLLALRRAGGGPATPLTQLTTRNVEALLRPLALTAHSIKRGALTQLLRAAAEDKLAPTMIAVMARHANSAPIAPVTGAYLSSAPLELARAMRTQDATALL